MKHRYRYANYFFMYRLVGDYLKYRQKERLYPDEEQNAKRIANFKEMDTALLTILDMPKVAMPTKNEIYAILATASLIITLLGPKMYNAMQSAPERVEAISCEQRVINASTSSTANTIRQRIKRSCS